MSLLQLSLDLKIVRCVLNTWSIFLYLIAAYFIAVVSILSSCINGNIEMITHTWISCRYCVSVPQILPEIINIWFEETGASFWMFTLMCWVDCLIYSFFPIFYNLWVFFFFGTCIQVSHACLVSAETRPEEGVRFPGIIDSCELPHRFSVLNMSPLEQQPVFLNAALSLDLIFSICS